MARRSSTKPASSSKSGKKRASPQAMVTPTRASKRLKTIEDARATSGSRSKVNYNEAGSGEELISEEEYKAEADEATAASSSDEDEDDDEESFSEEDTGRSSKRGSRKRAGRVHKKTRKEDPRISSGTGLGPGKQVVVKLPKPRSAGATPYEPHTIHPNTFLFLKDLAQNNSREWLKAHDPDFRASEKDFDSFIAVLSEKIVELDETIPELPTKDIPGHSFVGGGLWHPEAGPLARVRNNISRKPSKIRRVLTQPGIRKDFLNGIADDEEKAVAAFIEKNQDGMLKTKPKGFEADHPDIKLLRLRNFTVGKRLTDKDILGDGIGKISGVVGSLVPFITYLNSVVMPDDPSSESDAGTDGDN
ncbi:MAG: hypothetical protein M1815_003310 [Lichina confinis]|nr:MAG: hypothetical protein M1815_003310 [Lichina confinis]